jgi:POT family proton-dependent oligopeptide transporter
MNTNKTVTLKQPKVFYLAISTSMCERFGFYVLTFLLVLYTKDIYGLSDSQAFVLFGVFNGLAFLTPALGGYLADNVFGIRRCTILGLLSEGLGLMLLAIPTQIFFWIGLSLVIIGVGLFKTAPTNLMARSYTQNDPRIDSGFTLFYMAMNVGGFFAPIIAGFAQRYFGWHIAFLIGGLVLYLGLLGYFVLRRSAESSDSAIGRKTLSPKIWSSVIFGIIVSSVCFIFLLIHPVTADVFFAITALLLILFFIYEIIKSNKEDKLKIIACLMLIFIGMIFFVLYFQAFTSITLFIKRVVRHAVFGIDIPTVAFLSLNPLWIIVLSPILASLYNYLKKRNKDLPITGKFALGILIISLCFFVLKISTLFVSGEETISALWIVLAFFLFSLGELLVSALGVAMVAQIAPKRMYGVMMGTWFLIAATLGASVSGLLAGLANVPKALHESHAILTIYGKAFFHIGLIGLSLTIVIFLVSPYIKRMAKL